MCNESGVEKHIGLVAGGRLVPSDADAVARFAKPGMRPKTGSAGQRVQFFLFECLVENALWVQLRAKLVAAIEPETDSLRFYFLGTEWQRRIEHVGAKAVYDPEDPLIL